MRHDFERESFDADAAHTAARLRRRIGANATGEARANALSFPPVSPGRRFWRAVAGRLEAEEGEEFVQAELGTRDLPAYLRMRQRDAQRGR